MINAGRCKNCDAPLLDGHAFCAACGQKAATGRLTLHQIAGDLFHALVHVDRSVLSLVGALAVKPGEVAKAYVAGRRRRYFGPFAFLIVVVGLSSAVIALSRFTAFSTDTPNPVAAFLQRHVNLVILLQVPLLAAFCKLLFRKERLYFAEHLVLAAYTSAMRSLAFLFLVVPFWYVLRPGSTGLLTLFLLFLCVWLGYFGFAASRFYAGSRIAAGLKAVVAGVLAQATLQGIVSLITYAFFD